MPIQFDKRSRRRCGGLRSVVVCLMLLISGCGVSKSAPSSPNSETTHHQVDLSWEAPESSPAAVVGYHVYRAPGNSSSYQLLNSALATETVYLDTTVQSGLSYNYFVRSVDGSGLESDPSNTVTVTIP